jgi:thiamine kinase-like enzyme
VRTDENGERTARAALERMIDANAAANATVETLAGGINRRSYLVAAGGKRWVLQLPIRGAAGLLDVAAEAEVMRAAAAAGLAPRIAGVDAARGILLSEYRAGARPWSAADARLPRNIARAAALLRALHEVEAPVPVYAAERIVRQYLVALSAGVDARRARFDERSRRWADELLDLARHYDAAHPPSALCHNDLVAANFLDGGGAARDDGELVLVDFEYAVRGAPVLDLAGLAGLNDYGEQERRALLAAYCGDGRDRIALRELTKVVRMVRLVAFFWARLGEARIAEPASYAQLAADLERKLI